LDEQVFDKHIFRQFSDNTEYRVGAFSCHYALAVSSHLSLFFFLLLLLLLLLLGY